MIKIQKILRAKQNSNTYFVKYIFRTVMLETKFK